jgi:hypothetical protein
MKIDNSGAMSLANVDDSSDVAIYDPEWIPVSRLHDLVANVQNVRPGL